MREFYITEKIKCTHDPATFVITSVACPDGYQGGYSCNVNHIKNACPICGPDSYQICQVPFREALEITLLDAYNEDNYEVINIIRRLAEQHLY